MARRDLEENARKKLEEERLKRKEAKEAEWRAKYGFDKEDPLLKKKQQREQNKRNFYERLGLKGIGCLLFVCFVCVSSFVFHRETNFFF